MTKSSDKVIKINQESHNLCTFNTKVFKSSCEFTKYLMRHTSHAHSTQPYSTPHANLTKYLMRHTSHAHSTQSSATPHANLTKYLMRHTIHARSITKTNFTLQKTDLKTTNFPNVLSPFRKSSIQTTICIDQQTTNSC